MLPMPLPLCSDGRSEPELVVAACCRRDDLGDVQGEVAARLVGGVASLSTEKCLVPYVGERGGDLDIGACTAAMMAAVRAMEEAMPGSELDKPRAGPGSRLRGGKAEGLDPTAPPKRVPPDPNRYDGGMGSAHPLEGQRPGARLLRRQP